MPSKRRSQPKANIKLPVALMAGCGALLAVIVSVFLTAAHLEENDAFCAACHSEPERTYVARTQAEQVDLASAHHGEGVRCIDCHSGPGLTGRISAMQLGASDLLKFVTKTATQPAPLLQPIRDAHCLKCHADVPQARDFNQHFHAFLARWQKAAAGAATCVSCHTAHTTDGEVAIKFLQQQRTVQVCQDCHATAGVGG